MNAEFANGNIKAICPDCNVRATFEYTRPDKGEYGRVISFYRAHARGKQFRVHQLVRCNTCSRPGIASVIATPPSGAVTNNDYLTGAFYSFWPAAVPRISLPSGVPDGVVNEFREAETCMSCSANRGAVALLRSAIEKVLLFNGFNEKSLYEKIEKAGEAGVITAARRQKAHDFVRTLGNDVLHEDWRDVSADEVAAAHHYVGRVIEDLYDDRPTVEKVLISIKRLQTPATP